MGGQPLSGVSALGSAALIYMRKTPPDLKNAASCVQGVIDAGQAASAIFDDIRALFGKNEPAKDRVEVNALIAEVLRTHNSDFKSRCIVTHAALATELPTVAAHRAQMQEVLLNLVRNAIEAMDEVDDNRIMKLGTSFNGGGTITLTVEDTGPGLPPEKAAQIFDPFVTTKPKGVGLGLAICRKIVQRHGGELSVSGAKPHGAIFRVTLPQGDSAR